MTDKLCTIYRLATGEITGQQTFTGEVVVPNDCAAIRGAVDAERFYIVDGELVEYPPRPHRFAEFDFSAGQWVDHRTLADIKVAGSAKVLAWASATLAQFTAPYPKEEVASWSAKLPAARRVLAGEREAIIEIEAQALGVTPAALAAKVAAKGGQFEAIVAVASAIRGKTMAAIDAASSAAEVETVITNALASANAALAQFGVSHGG